MNARTHSWTNPPSSSVFPYNISDLVNDRSSTERFVFGCGWCNSRLEDLNPIIAMYDTNGLPVTTLDLGRILCEDVVKLLPEMGTDEFRLVFSLVKHEPGSRDGLQHFCGWLSERQRDTGWVLPKESEASHACEDVGVDVESLCRDCDATGECVELRKGVAAGIVEGAEEEHAATDGEGCEDGEDET
mgnify:CR=1 FL=1